MILSPLLLFFTLLIVLVVATTVKQWGLVSEGFIGYLKNAENFSNNTVNAYDNTRNIIKLYDDIFYDNRNGYSVIVAGPQATQDISYINIVPRNPNNEVWKYSVVSGNQFSWQSEESKIATIESLETEWYIKESSSTNQLVYITWGNDTYLYIMDLSNATVSGKYQPAISAYFNGTMKQSTNSYSVADIINLKSTFTYTSDGKDDTNIIVDFYDKVQTAYQLISNVWFDVKNGNLLIKTSGTSAKLDVYTRGSKTSSYSYTAIPADGNTTPASQISFSQSSVTPYFIQDATQNFTIMYWANGDNTILSVFKNALESDGIIKVKTLRFTRDGLYNANPNSGNEKKEDNKIDTSADKDLLDSFARWYIYFNTNAVGSSNSNDYLLKTQIVPPVCPACPGCKGVCTNCGGNGGSGTKTSDSSSSLAFDNKTVVGATGSLLNNTVDAAGNVVNKTVDTAGNVVGKTLDTAGNVVGKTLDTATNVVGKTFDAAGNVLGSAASTLGLDRVGYQQSYGGPVNNSSSANTNGYPSSGHKSAEYRPGSNNTGVSNYPNSKPNDPYSYNGALQSKGGNFMAVTADFSRFGR